MCRRTGKLVMGLLRRLETTLFAVGLLLVAVFALAELSGWLSASLALQRFEESYGRSSAHNTGVDAPVDFSLWSPQRIREYKESLSHKADVPLAVLRIPKLRLEVPVFDGTDDLTLNRGAGRIIGTARLGEPGNTGIAGHRDGFFRGLKDIGPGDRLELVLPGSTDRYVVSAIQITTPEDVSVLQPTDTPALTLVTCYPFYFVGSAPQRFIVRAVISPANGSGSSVARAEIP
jgi:sortase A